MFLRTRFWMHQKKHRILAVLIPTFLSFGPHQANLVLIAYASSEGSGEPAHPRSLARTSAARSYKQWVKRNLQPEREIPGPSEWLGMRSQNLSWRNARRHKFAWWGSFRKLVKLTLHWMSACYRMSGIISIIAFYINKMVLMYPYVVVKLILPNVGLNQNCKNRPKSECPKRMDLFSKQFPAHKEYNSVSTRGM